jgi:hypothetical protein
MPMVTPAARASPAIDPLATTDAAPAFSSVRRSNITRDIQILHLEFLPHSHENRASSVPPSQAAVRLCYNFWHLAALNIVDLSARRNFAARLQYFDVAERHELTPCGDCVSLLIKETSGPRSLGPSFPGMDF